MPTTRTLVRIEVFFGVAEPHQKIIYKLVLGKAMHFYRRSAAGDRCALIFITV